MRVKAGHKAILRPVRRLLVAILAATHRRRRGLVTVEEYLISRGVDEAGRKRWSSAFGRKVAGLRRAADAGAFDVSWIVWRGRVRRVVAYSDVSFLDAAWGHYAGKINGEG